MFPHPRFRTVPLAPPVWEELRGQMVKWANLCKHPTVMSRPVLPGNSARTRPPCMALRSTGSSSLNIRYTSMIDGTGKETGGSQTGEQDRVVDVDVAFVGHKALVLESVAAKSKKVVSLVFANEPDLHGELAKLRVAGDKKEKK